MCLNIYFFSLTLLTHTNSSNVTVALFGSSTYIVVSSTCNHIISSVNHNTFYFIIPILTPFPFLDLLVLHKIPSTLLNERTIGHLDLFPALRGRTLNIIPLNQYEVCCRVFIDIFYKNAVLISSI